MMSLSLIDASLAGNLLLIVIFSSYENFVSKIDTADHEDRPDWMGSIDFSGVKIKLIASIVAISAIAMLRVFINLTEAAGRRRAADLADGAALHLRGLGRAAGADGLGGLADRKAPRR